jgi:hypothetical protein
MRRKSPYPSMMFSQSVQASAALRSLPKGGSISYPSLPRHCRNLKVPRVVVVIRALSQATDHLR